MIRSVRVTLVNSFPREILLEAPSVQTTFYTADNQARVGYLGNKGLDNPGLDNRQLPRGFAVKETALSKPPWRFGQSVFLNATEYTLYDRAKRPTRIAIECDAQLWCHALRHRGIEYAYLVVRVAGDPRFEYEPIVIRAPLLSA